MRTTLKISLLVLVALLVAAGVLIYVKTIVSPPQKADVEHRYEASLQEDIDALPGVLDTEGADHNYLRVTDMLQLLYNERAIDSETHDKVMAAYIQAYASPYATKCYEYFTRSRWSEAEVKAMESRIRELRSVRNPSGSPVIKQTTNDSLRSVQDIIAAYRQAIRLAGITSFSSVSGARSVIDQAKKLSSDQYIRHNTEIVSALGRLPSLIGNSHFHSLQRSLNRLSEYPSMDLDSFMTLYREVLDDISVYDSVAAELYGNHSDTYRLKTSADDYHRRAVEYYASQKQSQQYQEWTY